MKNEGTRFSKTERKATFRIKFGEINSRRSILCD